MASGKMGTPTNVLDCSSIPVAPINVVGGFTASYQMLLVFKKVKLFFLISIASVDSSE